MIYKRCSIKEEVQEKEVNRIEEEKEVNQKNAKETNQ